MFISVPTALHPKTDADYDPILCTNFCTKNSWQSVELHGTQQTILANVRGVKTPRDQRLVAFHRLARKSI